MTRVKLIFKDGRGNVIDEQMASVWEADQRMGATTHRVPDGAMRVLVEENDFRVSL